MPPKHLSLISSQTRLLLARKLGRMRPGVGAPGERVPVASHLLDLNQTCLLQMKQAGQIGVYLRVEISLPDGRAGCCQGLQDRFVLQRAAQL